MDLILASSSPRRKDLLEQLGLKPKIIPSNVDEDRLVRDLTDPRQVVVTLAKSKVLEVCQNHRDNVILGADTVVYLDGEILGKPKDRDQAQSMLRRIAGKTHSVYTGVAFFDPRTGNISADCDCTYVTMKKMEDEEIVWYVNTGEPLDKAGSYALQGIGAVFVDRVEGDWSSVVGLPIPMVYGMLKASGFRLSEFIP